jgi:hypothetical protein
MKKIILSIAAVFAFGLANAQDVKYGAKAGLDFASSKVATPFGTLTDSQTGFFIGGFATIGISEKLAVQPELLYVSVKAVNFISIPILAKYRSALAGLSFNYFSDQPTEKLKINIDLGATYDVTQQIDVNAKYSMGLSGDIQVSGLFIGTGYKF